MPREFDVEKWLAIRKEEGLKINPETAEVMWIYAQTLDPYGVDPDLPEELQQVERAYFARSPEATYGSSSAISRKRRETPCGSGTNANWRSLPDYSRRSI
jgi:hypothetical protein